jgi:hypothetical protein
MQTKIEIPEGYEIDLTNSTFELIKFKNIKSKYPTTIEEVKMRNYFIDNYGNTGKSDSEMYCKTKMFTEKECEEHLAFIQVDMLCQAWNKIDGFAADWCDENVKKYSIFSNWNNLSVDLFYNWRRTISFKNKSTAELFLSTFRELLETCKRLL